MCSSTQRHSRPRCGTRLGRLTRVTATFPRAHAPSHPEVAGVVPAPPSRRGAGSRGRLGWPGILCGHRHGIRGVGLCLDRPPAALRGAVRRRGTRTAGGTSGPGRVRHHHGLLSADRGGSRHLRRADIPGSIRCRSRLQCAGRGAGFHTAGRAGQSDFRPPRPELPWPRKRWGSTGRPSSGIWR